MNFLKNIIYQNKTDILDPLSVILKLYIYNFKPEGTKISVSNNKIVLQDIGIFQGSVRKILGDSKNDINIIFDAINNDTFHNNDPLSLRNLWNENRLISKLRF